MLWAKYQCGCTAGAPSDSDSPLFAELVSCSWSATIWPDCAATTVAMVDRLRSPTFSTTNWPGGTTRPW